MLKFSFDELVAKIKEKSGLDEEEIRNKVESKVKQLSGLVSREGAAHILANELGIRLFEQQSGKLEIKNILSGMRDVEIIAKATAIYETRTFNSNGREGKLSSLMAADETGQIRIVLWGGQADNSSKIKPGDIIKIKGGYVKDRNSSNEIHLNERGKLIINPEGETVNVEIKPQASARKQLSQLEGTENSVEVIATLIQVFEPRYFEVCGCGKKLRQSEKGPVCEQHGITKPEYSYVLNGFIDDGTDSIRAVFFRDQAQNLLGKSHEELLQYKDAPELFENIRNEVLGSNVKIRGRASKNEMFNRVEIIANHVIVNPDPQPEIERLEREIEQLRNDNQAL
ncbi:hypothetical protein HYU11_01490 [Candidatus Woesearchaeota archaeon]|nr:hypothetical protein [Candidatus Woesearchaeota archaeon]